MVMINEQDIHLPDWVEIDNPIFDDYHATFTITLGELIHDGLINFTDGTWYKQPNGMKIDWYNIKQRNRFWKKFEQYYYYREIGEIPYKRWKDNLLSKIALLAPKFNLMYGILDQDIDPMQDWNEYGKSRNIYSDFPQTMLSGNEDYASTGNDNQYEKIKNGSFLEKMNGLYDSYDDVDMLFIRALDTHFYSLLSSNMNGL